MTFSFDHSPDGQQASRYPRQEPTLGTPGLIVVWVVRPTMETLDRSSTMQIQLLRETDNWLHRYQTGSFAARCLQQPDDCFLHRAETLRELRHRNVQQV